MDQLDLDINNYTILDLEKFFKLKPKSNYTAADIEEREYKIREQLLKSGHVDKRFKTELIEFLNKAKEWLDSIYNEAREIAGFIKKKDSEGLKKWCEKAILDILPNKENFKKAKIKLSKILKTN